MKMFLILAAVMLLSAVIAVCVALARRKRTEIRNMINNQPGAGESLTGIKTFTASTVRKLGNVFRGNPKLFSVVNCNSLVGCPNPAPTPSA